MTIQDSNPSRAAHTERTWANQSIQLAQASIARESFEEESKRRWIQARDPDWGGGYARQAYVTRYGEYLASLNDECRAASRLGDYERLDKACAAMAKELHLHHPYLFGK